MVAVQDESTIGLRMQGLATPATPRTPHSEGKDQTVECILAMMHQEPLYTCRDYLEQRGRSDVQHEESRSDLEGLAIPAGEEIDELCREKMCEWGYRVCDHFGTSREIVAFAFSFLDRFVDRCACDRTAFKLASMTALYLATKLFNAKQISIKSLAELSRGEFEVSHISEMERILIKTLEWRLNPPTAQSYILKLHDLIPFEDMSEGDAVLQRATFFAELAVYDYMLVTHERLQLGVACLLNALEGLDESIRSSHLEHDYLKKLGSVLSSSFVVEEIDAIQSRLWFLYSCSAQLEEDDAMPVKVSQRLVLQSTASRKSLDDLGNSPVSVLLLGRF